MTTIQPGGEFMIELLDAFGVCNGAMSTPYMPAVTGIPGADGRAALSQPGRCVANCPLLIRA
jgi:hypothetical protein